VERTAVAGAIVAGDKELGAGKRHRGPVTSPYPGSGMLTFQLRVEPDMFDPISGGSISAGPQRDPTLLRSLRHIQR
jgi:hypothetical protein